MNPQSEIHREIEKQPSNDIARLENHILAESFKMDGLDYDKIQKQAGKLDAMKKDD